MSRIFVLLQQTIAMKYLSAFYTLLLCCSQLFCQEDSTNRTDNSGKKQGKWIIIGSDLPDSGVMPSGKVEEGNFVDDQKTGAWIRYSKDGKTPNALIYYAVNPATNTSNRIAFFSFKYAYNGVAIVEPFQGDCSEKANQIVRFESGEIKEITYYDNDCQEACLVVAMDSAALQELPYFEITNSFVKKIETPPINAKSTIQSNLNGYYLIDDHHSFFQLGYFKNGQLITGKECVLDENMSLLHVRIIQKGIYQCSYLLE
jgi:hypothetical protein